MVLDIDDCLILLTAVVRQWAADARRDPEELAGLATWLEMTPTDLQRRIKGDNRQVRVSAFYRVCLGCGRVIPERAGGKGRLSLYCSDRCRRRAAKKRARQKNYDAAE